MHAAVQQRQRLCLGLTEDHKTVASPQDWPQLCEDSNGVLQDALVGPFHDEDLDLCPGQLQALVYGVPLAHTPWVPDDQQGHRLMVAIGGRAPPFRPDIEVGDCLGQRMQHLE